MFRYQLKNLPNADDWQKNWNYNGKSSKVNDIQYDYYVMCIKNHKRAIEYVLWLNSILNEIN